MTIFRHENMIDSCQSSFKLLLEAQARIERDAILKRAAMQAANQTFQSAVRGYQEAISQKDVATLRDAFATLTLRSETEARIAQQLYDRYQAARAIGATEEELAELESRFARIAG